MKNLKIAFLSVAVSTLLTGCISSILEPKVDPTEFYVMRAASDIKPVSLTKKYEINMMNVLMPSYMERNQMVMLDDGSVEISEFNRWAESPMDGVQRSLVENLSLASDKISVYVYPAMSFKDDSLSLRISINDCIGQLGGNLKFTGRWQLASNSGKDDLSKAFNYSIPCGNTYKSYVEAINEAIKRLSIDIVENLKNFETKEK